VASWGRSERNAAPAAIPETAAMRQKAADAQQVLQRGGVLAADYDRMVRPQEIMRLLVIAIYRQRVLLGDLASQSAGLDAATKALARRPAPPNHWSQSWIDVALGAAHWAQGKHDLAAPLLTRGLLVGNGLDHGLTSWGLIILGRMALDADQPTMMQLDIASQTGPQAAGGMVEPLLGHSDQFLRPGGQAPGDGAQADTAILQQASARDGASTTASSWARVATSIVGTAVRAAATMTMSSIFCLQ
jgi:hypothetical protein